ncbi:hypothetical protein BJY52DRAFT_1223704 [Lactarius psammicola]|nr:hypothetical protein BJY52DRAFT_1223704 [Lactarius psammicola]
MPGNIVPSVAIPEGPSLIVRLYDAAKAVKIHKVIFQPHNTLPFLDIKLRDHSPRLVGTSASVEADEVERAIERILNRVLVWVGHSDATAFVKQNEVQLGIDECYRELSACSNRFAHYLWRTAVRIECERRPDNVITGNCCDLLADFLEEVRRSGRSVVSEPLTLLPPQVNQDSQQAVTAEARGGANQVVISPRHRSADLSGKVSIVSDHVVIEGRFLDFYIGEWTNDGALRFKERVESWRGLHHRNVLSFFGHVQIEGSIYSVSPWMENGNIRDYVRGNPDADRMRLLSEVASGMEFLHENGIVHGDLCGKNVLISGDGKAFICGFNLSEFVNPTSDVSRGRWLAPERITSASVTSPTFKADVWSFGLLCLEVFTDADPYSSYSDLYVPVLLSQGKPPEDPGTAAVGLSSKMWELMQSCWEVDPVVRPDMDKIQLAMRNILPRVVRQAQNQANLVPPTIDGSSSHETSRSSSETSSLPPPLTPPPMNRGLQLLPESSTATSPPPLSRLADIDANGRSKRGSNASSLTSARLLIPVSPTTDGSPSRETSRSSSENSSIPAPLTPPPTNRGLQLTLDPSTTANPLPLSRLVDIEAIGRPKRGSTTSSLTSARLPTLQEDDHYPHSPGIPIPLSAPAQSPLISPMFSGSSRPRPSTAPNTSSHSIRASDLQRHASVDSSSSRSSTSTGDSAPRSERNRSRWLPFPPRRSRTSSSGTDGVASDPESLLRRASDGSVSVGNLEGLLTRVITGSADPSRDESFKAVFLTIYQLFASSEQLFGILKRRFESSAPLDPAMARLRYNILVFIESWLNKGFEDPELTCSSKIRAFARSVSGSQTMEAKARDIASLVDDPDYVRLRNPESCPRLRREPAPRPPGVTPSDVANALTVIEGSRFERITYWDYVNFIRQRPNTRRIEVFNTVHDLIEAWVQRTVLGFDYVEERMKKFEFWVSTAQVEVFFVLDMIRADSHHKACRKLNNFSSMSAIVTALTSPTITSLALTCETRAAKQALPELVKELTQTDGSYRNVIRKAATKELIPWLNPHLTSLNSTFVQSNPVMEVNGHSLIDFKLLGELAEQVDSIVQYTPPRIEHATRQDVLAYIEYNLKSGYPSNSDDASSYNNDVLDFDERLENFLGMRSHTHILYLEPLATLILPPSLSISPLRMSPQDIVPAAGLNEISGSGILIASSLIRAAKNVKIYRSQCDDLSRRCLDLVSALRDHSPGLEGTRAQQAVDEVERVLTCILKRVAKWAELGKMRSFVKQTEIRTELEDSYRELQTCSIQFNIALHLYATNRSQELEEIRRRDHDELIEMITRVLHDKNLLKVALAVGPPEDAHSVVQAIEQAHFSYRRVLQELREADFGETQERELQEDFSELRRWVEKLPPMVDRSWLSFPSRRVRADRSFDSVSGNVTRTSDHPIATGGSQDIYTGEWTGQEVALAYPRNQTRAAQERFQRQVEIWRTLRHPNVLPLLGIAYIGNCVYSVSPYMEFGNIMQYLKVHPEAHRVLLLSEIASGAFAILVSVLPCSLFTSYRIPTFMRNHPRGFTRETVTHVSQISAAPVLKRSADNSRQVEITEALTYGSTRWLAPELMTQSNLVPTTRNTDVWSFGMLGVEIFTDNVPFSHIQNEIYLPLVIRDGSLPTRPEDDITTKGLTDAMWDLMNRCWRREPESRPKMPEIREAIQNMLPMRSVNLVNSQEASQMGRSSSLIGGLHPNGPTPSLLSTLRPAHSTGLTPPSAPLPLPITPTRGDGQLSDQRGSGFPSLYKSPIFKDMPLSSSPPSANVPTKPVPSPPNPSPLSSSLQTTQIRLSTTPESLGSLSPSGIQPDWRPFSWSKCTLLPRRALAALAGPQEPGPHLRDPGHNSDRDPATSLLDAAARDPKPVLSPSARWCRRSWDIGGISGIVWSQRHMIMRKTMSTRGLFTTGEDLFRILKRRFDEMGDVLPLFTHHGPLFDTRILLFLRAWLSAEGERVDRELLSSIGTFASTVSGSDTMKEVAREIVDLVGKNMDVVIAPPVSPLQPSSGRPVSPLSPDQIKALDIAVSLTVIEGERYAQISRADYVAHLRGAVSKHIESAMKVNNRLVNWVKKKILGSEDVQKRATNFRLFVLVAEVLDCSCDFFSRLTEFGECAPFSPQECRKLQNFSSMSTIIVALQSATSASSTTSQLVLTRESRLSKSEKQILRQLEDLLDPRNDHRTYREALQNIKSPFAIPWLAVHLHSLKAFYDRSSAVVVVDQRPLINFSRCVRLLERIGEVQRYRAPAPADLLEKHHTQQHHRRSSSSSDSIGAGAGVGAAALAWAKAELENAPSSISRERFEARVRELAEKERRMRETHELELRSLGFGPSTPRSGTSTRGSSVRSPPARIASLDTTRTGWT